MVLLNNVCTAGSNVFIKRSLTGEHRLTKFELLFYQSICAIPVTALVLYANVEGGGGRVEQGGGGGGGVGVGVSWSAGGESVGEAGWGAGEVAGIAGGSSGGSAKEAAEGAAGGEGGSTYGGDLTEFAGVVQFQHWGNPTFLVCFLSSCGMGLVLNYTAAQCTQYNSALTTTVVGCFKNVLVSYMAMAGLGGDYLFSWPSFLGLNISIVGSLLFSYEKYRANSAGNTTSGNGSDGGANVENSGDADGDRGKGGTGGKLGGGGEVTMVSLKPVEIVHAVT
jgi:hypothetical protein